MYDDNTVYGQDMTHVRQSNGPSTVYTEQTKGTFASGDTFKVGGSVYPESVQVPVNQRGGIVQKKDSMEPKEISISPEEMAGVNTKIPLMDTQTRLEKQIKTLRAVIIFCVVALVALSVGFVLVNFG